MYDVRHDIQIHTLYVAINRLYLYLIANLLYEDGGVILPFYKVGSYRVGPTRSRPNHRLMFRIDSCC